MAYSGTVSQTNFTTRKVIDSAMRRCRLRAEQITAEHISIANDQLYLFLSDLANQGLPLWCVQKSIYPLYEGTPLVVTYTGTVDILNANLRSLQQLTGSNTDTATERVVDFATSAAPSTVGIKWSGGSAPLEFARSDDNATWAVIQTETPDASAGEWTWFDLDTTIGARYFRVRATTGTLDVSAVYLGGTPTEIPLSRLNRDQYTNLPNKTFQSSRPLQFWLDRQAAAPVMNLWPVPNGTAETSQIVVWAQRHIMDVGTMTQQVEVPQRWLEALTAGLAAKLAMELAEVDPQLIGILDQKAAIALATAQAEERDNSPVQMLPNFSAYTR